MNQTPVSDQAHDPPLQFRRPRGRAGGRRSAAPQEPLSGEQLLERKWKMDIEFTVSEFADAPDEVICELIARLQRIYIDRAEQKQESQSWPG